LRHRPLGGVDEQEAAIGHIEHALHLAAEIGVPGRVDHIDLHVLVGDRGVLGEDRDAALALEVVGVEDQFAGGVRIPEDVGLLEEAVDEGGLAVVDVGDDGDVAQVGPARDVEGGGHGHGFRGGWGAAWRARLARYPAGPIP